MKKFLTFLEKCILGLIIIFKSMTIFIFYAILIFFLYQIISTTTKSLYKENWNIEIPNPQKQEYLIDFGHNTLQKMKYSNDNIIELSKQTFIKKIANENKDSIAKEYEEQINQTFINHLTEDDKKKFMNLKLENLIVENNYYALIEINDKKSSNYKYVIFLIDTKSNTLYSIIYKAHIR